MKSEIQPDVKRSEQQTEKPTEKQIEKQESSLRVLLADDEALTLDLLKRLIPWQDLQMRCIGCAGDGKEALALARLHHPDIIITDIRMPRMDGLTLIRKLATFLPRSKVIVMSAYADFSYIKSAMQLHCSNYILKPLDERELCETLRQTAAEISGSRQTMPGTGDNTKQLRMMTLWQFMQNGSGESRIAEMFDPSDFDFSRCIVLLIRINSCSISEHVYATEMNMVRENYILSDIEGKLRLHCPEHILAFSFEEGSYIFLLETPSCGMLALCRNLEEDIQRSFSLHMQFCFSCEGRCLSDLPRLYKQVVHLSKYGYFIGDESVFGYDDNCEGEKLDAVCRAGLLREAEQAIDNRDYARLECVLDDVIDSARHFHPDVLDSVYELCYRIILQLETCAVPSGSDPYEPVTYAQLHSLPSFHDIRRHILALCRSVFALSPEMSQRMYSSPVSRCIRMLEEQYAEDLSLETISAEIAVSKNYFCYLFKRETGVSVWNYLTNIRIRRAKELLLQTDMKSYEISFQVGYDNPGYFSKIFKKLEGMTPNEFREQKTEYRHTKQ